MTFKRAVMRAIAAALSSAAPALGDNVFDSYEEADRVAKFPHLVLVAGKMEFMPWVDDEVDSSDANELDPSKGLVHVGQFEGRAQLHIGAHNRPERDTIEDQVFAAFFQREGASGVLIVSAPDVMVGGVRTGYAANGACTLESDEWRDERVLAKARYQFIDVGLVIPAVVLRADVPDLAQLIASFSIGGGDIETSTPFVPYSSESFNLSALVQEGSA